jgi:hypothetical protein
MADEIQLAMAINISKDFYVCNINKSWTLDLNTAGEGGGIQIIGTSEEAVDFGDVATLGYLYLVNLDATNFITFGPDSGGMVEMGKLLPGEAALVRLKPGITVMAKADTANCNVLVRCWDGGT